MKKIFISSIILIYSSIFLSCSTDLDILFNSERNIIIEGFKLDKWTLTYDAVLDSSGYIELTGYANSKQGVIYNDRDRLDAGDIKIDFSIRTGPDVNPNGADGFAMTIADVPTGSDFVNYLSKVYWGACLGYGVQSSDCGNTYTVESFHIEFDTFENGFETPLGHDNHIAITADGDPTNHLLYKSLNIEDYVWHAIHIEIKGSTVIVTMDGAEIINDIIPGFLFKGGFVMFSGSTGGWKNYHSVKDLVVYK